MAGNRGFYNSEFAGMGEDDFDPEDDALPSDILVLRRKVESATGIPWMLEAHITKHDDESGVTWIKMFEEYAAANFSHCYVDTIDAELILNCIENYIRIGKGHEVEKFFQENGRTAMNPVTFRMKLETMLGSSGLGDSEAAADGLF